MLLEAQTRAKSTPLAGRCPFGGGGGNELSLLLLLLLLLPSQVDALLANVAQVAKLDSRPRRKQIANHRVAVSG